LAEKRKGVTLRRNYNFPPSGTMDKDRLGAAREPRTQAGRSTDREAEMDMGGGGGGPRGPVIASTRETHRVRGGQNGGHDSRVNVRGKAAMRAGRVNRGKCFVRGRWKKKSMRRIRSKKIDIIIKGESRNRIGGEKEAREKDETVQRSSR